MKKSCLFIVLIAVSVNIFAQDGPTKEELFAMSFDELMSVSVASNVAMRDEIQPVSVTTIDRKQLELSGARTLAEAIMTYVPGFFVVEDQDDLIAGFRGLAPDNNSKVLFLINGQNMNTEWFWGPPAALLNSTNMGYIEKIEIIRGPGSVTLGQGALLGVLNIVTKNGKSLQALNDEIDGRLRVGIGENNFQNISAELMQKDKDFQSYFYFAKTDYNGQQLRNQGWVAGKNNEGYAGGQVYDIGTRLNRSFNTMLFGNMHYKGFTVNMLYADNEHDLYNFYRDRNVMGQKLISFAAEYRISVNDDVNIKIMSDGAIDNYSLNSVDGPVMGGTRENRGGVKAIANINDLFSGNRLAIGLETRYFQFGQKNFDGHNFILNVYDQAYVDTLSDRARLELANNYNTMGYADSYMIFSAFIEDFYAMNDNFSLFGALRYDMHPYWGSHVSPRIGIIGKMFSDFDIRLSYQGGYRGAVGLHYGGGYRQDGFLRADNYNSVSDANIPIDPSNIALGNVNNLDEVKPEKMHSLELAVNYRSNEYLRISAVGFYNQIENVIDVGVIGADADQFIMPQIGTDVPGNWNGYWYFKNTEGFIHQTGLELSGNVKIDRLSVGASHSLVKLISADNQQKGSMYITNRDNFKAYPENVSRIHLIFDFTHNLALSANYLYYHSWYSPRDQFVRGNHLLNISGIINMGEFFETSFSVKNILAQNHLYPMNNNAGDFSLSDGTPSVEKPTYWIKLAYKF